MVPTINADKPMCGPCLSEEEFVLTVLRKPDLARLATSSVRRYASRTTWSEEVVHMQARQYMSLLAAVVVLGGHASGAQGTRDQGARDRQMRFQAMDTDRDGVITRAEWRGSLQTF